MAQLNFETIPKAFSNIETYRNNENSFSLNWTMIVPIDLLVSAMSHTDAKRRLRCAFQSNWLRTPTPNGRRCTFKSPEGHFFFVLSHNISDVVCPLKL